MRRYLARAPRVSALWNWAILGAVRARLFGNRTSLVTALGPSPADFRVQVGTRGEEILVNPRSSAELNVFDEVVVARNYPLPIKGFRPAMILDCGANIGYFACQCRLIYPEARLVCWEPDPHNFARLRAQPLLRDSTSVELHRAAVGVADGTVSLTGTDNGCVVQSAGAEPAERQARVVSLGDWMQRHAQFPLLLKMDIEGHEAEVIPALAGVWKAPTALLLETHAVDGADSALIASLRSAGFQTQLLRQHALPADPRIFKEYLAMYA